MALSAIGVALLLAVAVAIAPKAPAPAATVAAVDPGRAVQERACDHRPALRLCHSAHPTQPGFATAPASMMLDNETEIRQHAAQIYKQAIELQAMPIGNLTNMTQAERSEVERLAATDHARSKMTTQAERITAWIDEHFDEEVAFLQKVVQQPADAPPGNNAPHADLVAQLLQAYGWQAEKHAVPADQVEAYGMPRASQFP